MLTWLVIKRNVNSQQRRKITNRAVKKVVQAQRGVADTVVLNKHMSSALFSRHCKLSDGTQKGLNKSLNLSLDTTSEDRDGYVRELRSTLELSETRQPTYADCGVR